MFYNGGYTNNNNTGSVFFTMILHFAGKARRMDSVCLYVWIRAERTGYNLFWNAVLDRAVENPGFGARNFPASDHVPSAEGVFMRKMNLFRVISVFVFALLICAGTGMETARLEKKRRQSRTQPRSVAGAGSAAGAAQSPLYMDQRPRGPPRKRTVRRDRGKGISAISVKKESPQGRGGLRPPRGDLFFLR